VASTHGAVGTGTLALRGIEELDLDATLRSGQVFRWRRGDDGVWVGAIRRRTVWLAQSDDATTVTFAVSDAEPAEAAAGVRAFLRLEDLDLTEAAARWCAADPYFAAVWEQNPGVRVLRQDPEECFFSFLCASVAPIARIAAMLGAVATAAGDPLPGGAIAFPHAAQIARLSERQLRGMGLGFRARRVAEAAAALTATSPGALHALRGRPLAEIRAALCAYHGVGTKIADCIALFALDCDAAVPVDTHVWRLACTRYAPQLAGRSLTATTYAEATRAFHERFGPYAGWAQQILFYRAAVGRTPHGSGRT
jgi:N-glycosylase/DNA lyase